jgi:hypothetical protein
MARTVFFAVLLAVLAVADAKLLMPTFLQQAAFKHADDKARPLWIKTIHIW